MIRQASIDFKEVDPAALISPQYIGLSNVMSALFDAWPNSRPVRLRDPAQVAEIEGQVREVFLQLRANTDVARVMFEGYPAYTKSIEESPVMEPTTKSLHAMPRLRSPDDRFTAITRLRFVMEDPTQLLSNSVAHFVIDQLCAHNNQPELVVIPGFSKVSYPTREHGTLP